jgi:drug/metabolite transporter (DMT)-like permease
MILIILLYALFATSFSMGKILLQYSPPIFLNGCRMFIAGSILLTYQYFNPREKFHFKRSHIWLYAQVILFGVYFGYNLRFWALHYLPSSKASFLYNLSPFLSSYYSYIFFKERLSPKQWIGLVVGFVGLIPILLTSSPTEKSVGEWAYISWPEIAILVSVAAHSYSWIVMRRLVKEKGYSPMMANGITMTTGGIAALGTSFVFENVQPVTDWVAFFSWLALVILISNIICHNLYGFLLKRYTATFMSFAGFLTPLFTALYGVLFLNECITWHFYLSSAIVFVGLMLFYQDELKKHYPVPLDIQHDDDIAG